MKPKLRDLGPPPPGFAKSDVFYVLLLQLQYLGEPDPIIFSTLKSFKLIKAGIGPHEAVYSGSRTVWSESAQLKGYLNPE
jgi:hypothetical protein